MNRANWKWIWGVCAVAALAVLWQADALSLDLQTVQIWHVQWRDKVLASPWLSSLAFVAMYALATAASIPGAALMTLLGGAWFGIGWGTALVSIASTLGATGAMLIARLLLRDWVSRTWPRRIEAIQRGFEKDSKAYLLSLRLIPAIPFFAVNLGVGLTKMPVTTYVWVSALGMFPATVLYVNAGAQLGQISGLSGLLAPEVLLSLVALAGLPWFIKGLQRWLRYRQRVQPWRGHKPKQFDRNLIVIGGGAAGLVGAYMGATLQAKVTLIEQSQMGGDCLNTGCVPSKALLHTAHLIQAAERAQTRGLGTFEKSTNAFLQAMAHVTQSIQAIAPNDSAERYESLGVEVIAGYAQLVSPWHVRISPAQGETYILSAKHILLATGGIPIYPDLPGLDPAKCLTSDHLWDHLRTLTQAPKRMAIIGAGPIGCEISQAMNALGTEVHVFERAKHALPRADADTAAVLHQRLIEEGVRIHTQSTIQAVVHQGDQTTLTWEMNGHKHTLQFDVLLAAVGRRARHEGLGLEALGIDCETHIEHNAYLQTVWPHIWVAGDAAGPLALTHAAGHQGSTVALNTLLAPFWRRSSQAPWMPSVVYTHPEVAQAGLTEREALQQDISFETTVYPLHESDRAVTEHATDGFLKILTDARRGHVLGVSIVGDQASMHLPLWVSAIQMRRTPASLLSTIHAYPSWTEASKAIAAKWQMSRVKPWMINLLRNIQDLKRHC